MSLKLWQKGENPRWKLDLNERSEAPPAWAAEIFARMPSEALWKYVDRCELEEKIASRFGLDPSEVLATNGGDEAIAYVLSNLPANTEVLLPLPIFGFYREQAAFWPVRAVTIAARADHGLDWAGLEEALAVREGGLLVLTRPNNPTGETAPAKRIEELVRRCGLRGTRVLLDEAYAEFASDDLIGALRALPNLILLRTFSKAFGLAGLRIGYLLGATRELAPLRKHALPYNLASTSVWAGMRALEADALAEVAAYAGRVREGRARIEAQLRGFGLKVFAGEANFLFFSTSELRARWIYSGLAAQGIAIRRFEAPELAGCLRVTIPAEIAELQAALNAVLAPQLLCLDVDGTLMDTSGSFDAVVFKLVASFGGEAVKREELLAKRRISGFNDDYQLARQLLRERGIEVDFEVLLNRANELYFGKGNHPGLNATERPLIRAEVLARIAEKVPIALITGRTRRELEPVLPRLGLEGVFAATIDGVSAGKPDPEGIHAAMARQGATRVWMVGDNLDDVLAGRAAGALTIAVGPNREALLSAGAVLALDEIEELEGLFL